MRPSRPASTAQSPTTTSRASPGKPSGRKLRNTAVLDWATLPPVDRMELLTTHDQARREKQKLELLRGVLTYFQYAAKESDEQTLRNEINRINALGAEVRSRWRDRYEASHDDDDDDYDDDDPETDLIKPAATSGRRHRAWRPLASISAMSSLVSYELNDAVATITMDDGKVNALSPAMQAEINAALDQAAAGAGCRRGESRGAGGQFEGVQRRVRPERVLGRRCGGDPGHARRRLRAVGAVSDLPGAGGHGATGHAIAMGSVPAAVEVIIGSAR